MSSYILRRILVTIPVMAIVALFVFSLLYIAPGDPAAVIAGDQARALALTGRSWSSSAAGSGESCISIWVPRSSPICRSRP
jgi:ABC-type dipeptide/oligopeptide/nickel transport system permease component